MVTWAHSWVTFFPLHCIGARLLGSHVHDVVGGGGGGGTWPDASSPPPQRLSTTQFQEMPFGYSRSAPLIPGGSSSSKCIQQTHHRHPWISSSPESTDEKLRFCCCFVSGCFLKVCVFFNCKFMLKNRLELFVFFVKRDVTWSAYETLKH